LTANAP
jgi:hypothetical protein